MSPDSRIIGRTGRATVTLNESAALAPGANLRELIAWSATKPHGEDLAWVGHAPDVSYLAAELLGTQGLGLQFRKGAILALDFSDHIEWRHGRLSWFVWPKLLTKPE